MEKHSLKLIPVFLVGAGMVILAVQVHLTTLAWLLPALALFVLMAGYGFYRLRRRRAQDA